MEITLPLKEMSVAEKLRLMEVIWESISQEPDALEVPDWQLAIVAERDRQLAEGKVDLLDWEEVKRDF